MVGAWGVDPGIVELLMEEAIGPGDIENPGWFAIGQARGRPQGSMEQQPAKLFAAQE